MPERKKALSQKIEVRGKLSPEQKKICDQLVTIIQELESIEIQAMGVTNNIVVFGGKKSPCVWFKFKDLVSEFKVVVVVIEGKVWVTSDFSFLPYRDVLKVRPFGVTLGKWELYDQNIELEE